MRTGLSLSLTLALVALVAAGCGSSGSKHAAAPPATGSVPTTTATTGASTSAVGACRPAPRLLMSRIRAKVVLKNARLADPQMVTSKAFPGLFFVSAHVLGGGADPHSVATWATANPAGGGSIYAIDSNAALISEFGAGVNKDPDLTVQAPGVFRSRACVGGPNVSPGTTAPPSGGHGSPGTG